MLTKRSLTLNFIWTFLCLLLQVSPSLAYSLKNCTILYQENPSADVSLDCANRKLLTVPDDIPKDAVSVDLYVNLIQRINKDDFSEMRKLKLLNLMSNTISHVEDGAFSHLASLKTLSFSRNKLTNLTNNMFQGLSNLTLLDLKDNWIEFIHNSAFSFLINLEVLELNTNAIQKITDILPILQLPKIRRLGLGCSKFNSFETKDLPLNLSSNLNELDVSSLHLKTFSITTPVFPYLQTIDLSSCSGLTDAKWNKPNKTLLSNITQLYFKGRTVTYETAQDLLTSLSSLRHLQLSLLKEWIEKALLSTICKIPTLRRLNLLENYLEILPTELPTCYQLTDLDLSINRMTEVPEGSIQPMALLESLNMSQNLLFIVPQDVRSFTHLKILDLSLNRILALTCEDFMNATHLTELYLNSNRIVKLDKCTFQNLTELKRLDLSDNPLRKFGDTFKVYLKKLEFLDIKDTLIPSLKSRDYQSLQSLKQLNAGTYFFEMEKPKTFPKRNNHEALQHREPIVYGLQQLEIFTFKYVEQNTFTSSDLNIDDYPDIPFKSMKRLTAICFGDHPGLPYNIPDNMMRRMEHLESFTAVNIYAFPPYVDTFKFNPQLKSLSFAETDLSNLNPEVFRPIQKLQVLDLSKTKLKSLDFLFQANLSALRYLKLSNNELTVINETVFLSLPSLTYLDLSNNMFICECSNAGFIQWTKSNKQTQVANTHEYICYFPINKRGSLLLDFDIQSCWDNGNFFYFISSTCLVLLIMITSLVHHFLRWHLVYTFHLFMAFLYDQRKGKRGDDHQFDAFVSYNVCDEDWVYREMLPVLEGEQGWRLCLHHRDFQPGKPIIENITDAIYGSRKTICVISRSYLQSEWCSREIQMASFRLFDEKKDVLILLFLDDIPSRHLSPHYRMRKLVKKRSYLSWSQAAQHPGVFWQNVQRALQTGGAVAENTNLLLDGPAGR